MDSKVKKVVLFFIFFFLLVGSATTAIYGLTIQSSESSKLFNIGLISVLLGGISSAIVAVVLRIKEN